MSAGRSQPLRVAFLIDRMEVGGTETQLELLLRRLDRSRVQPYLCRLADEGRVSAADFDCEGFIVGETSLRPPGSVTAVRRLARWLRGERIDLLVTFFRDATLFGAAAAWRASVPMISTRRNIGYWHSPFELRLLRLANRATARIAANSEAAKRITVEREGFPASRVEVIYNAIDLSRFAAGKARREPTRQPIFGCVANLRKIKDHATLLQAFALARKALPEAKLQLVGDGEERASLERLARSLGVASDVEFLGLRADVPELLSRLDVAVLASRSESFPQSLVEAMAAGLPVVATAVGGATELVSPQVGRLVPAGEPQRLAAAMIELGRDAGLRRSLGASARQVAEARFSLRPILDRWHTLFEAVASANRLAPGEQNA